MSIPQFLLILSALKYLYKMFSSLIYYFYIKIKRIGFSLASNPVYRYTVCQSQKSFDINDACELFRYKKERHFDPGIFI